MDAVAFILSTARLIYVLLPSSAQDVGAAELAGPPADALPDGPVVQDAVAESAPVLVELGAPVAAAVERAEPLAEVLADVPPAQDEAEPSVQVPGELGLQVAAAVERAELLAEVLAGVPPVQDEAELSVSVPGEPAVLDAAELRAWTPAVELARRVAAEPDDSPVGRIAQEDSLAFEPAPDVVPSFGSQAPAELAAGIVAEPACSLERAWPEYRARVFPPSEPPLPVDAPPEHDTSWAAGAMLPAPRDGHFRPALQIARGSKKLRVRAEPARLLEASEDRELPPAPEAWAAPQCRPGLRCNSLDWLSGSAHCSCKRCEPPIHPHSSPRGCIQPGRYSNTRHNIHGPCIHSHNRCRRNSRCEDPSSRDANDRRRYRNPTRAASITRPHKELRSTHREPSNSPSSRSPNIRESKCNRRREREAGCNRAAAVVVLKLPPAVRRKRFDRKARSGRIAVHCIAVHCKNHREGARSSDRMPVLARAATAAAGTRIDPPEQGYRSPDHRYSLAEADSAPSDLAFYCKHLARWPEPPPHTVQRIYRS